MVSGSGLRELEARWFWGVWAWGVLGVRVQISRIQGLWDDPSAL